MPLRVACWLSDHEIERNEALFPGGWVAGDSVGQVLVLLPATVPRARAVRGTVIAASQRGLRQAGLFDSYWAHVPERFRVDLETPVANSWLPMELALAHYQACDALDLSPQVIDELGRNAGTSVNAVFVQSVLRLAADAVSPWFAWPHAQRIWSRGWDGSALGVERAGPKDVRVTVAGFPCASVSYVQRALCGFFVRNTELFCRRAHGQILPSPIHQEMLRYVISWV